MSPIFYSWFSSAVSHCPGLLAVSERKWEHWAIDVSQEGCYVSLEIYCCPALLEDFLLSKLRTRTCSSPGSWTWQLRSGYPILSRQVLCFVVATSSLKLVLRENVPSRCSQSTSTEHSETRKSFHQQQQQQQQFWAFTSTSSWAGV